MTPPFVLLETGTPGRTLLFEAPERLILARRPEEVAPAFAAMEQARRDGLHLAGFAAYELGYVLEDRLRPLSRTPRVPLLAFGAFREPRPFDGSGIPDSPDPLVLTPDWSADEYGARFRRVIDYIRAGDVYQVNLTFPMRGRFAGDPLALHARLRRAQPTRHGALVALGEAVILSRSPELFFAIEGETIRARPMKGTAPRGATPEADARNAARLAASEKDRAENLMIVDLLRNDLGRLARMGSVRVTDMFTVETYPTVLQMTSGIEARLRPGLTLAELFAGIFPCGSVTGAPKIRAMEIIAELEPAPRGVYCGTIGWMSPDGNASFNVAIRTLTLHDDGEAVLNVGSGVVIDSQAEAEYQECLLKARFLTGPISA